MGGYFHHPPSCASPVPFPTLPHAFRNSSARFGEYSVVDTAHGVLSWSVGGFWVVSVMISGGGCEEVHDCTLGGLREAFRDAQ